MGQEHDCIICRCEEIYRKQIEEAIAAGCTDVDSVKKATRAGMGLCQGRTCRNLVTRIIAEKAGIPPAEQTQYSVRAPFRPIPLEAIANT
ncbi:MAG: (2Fe-2S)-binding protein, partial [Clostridia bacterium]|nr:(2Fe-2S)-binding protein [Clostridia bacterium]